MNLKVFKSKLFIAQLTIILFLLFFAGQAVHFAIYDRTPMNWDNAGIILRSLNNYSALKNHNIIQFLTSYGYLHPPLVSWLFGITIVLFGFSKLTIILFNLFLFLLLLGVVYWYTKNTTDSYAASIITIFIFGFTLQLTQSYGIRSSLYELMLDFPLTVTTTVSFCILMYGILKQRYTFFNVCLAGISVAVAILTKETAITFLLVPASVYVFNIWKQKKFIELIAFIFTTCACSGWWFLYNSQTLLYEWKDLTHQTQMFSSPLTYLDYVNFFYPLALLWIIPSFILFIYSFYSSRRIPIVKFNKGSSLFWTIPLCLLLLNIIVFMIIPVHEFRFLYPVIFISAFSYFGITLKYIHKAQRDWLLLLCIIFSCFAVQTYRPIPSLQKPAYDDVKHFIETNTPRSIACFFEANSSTFNAASMEVLTKEFELSRHRITLEALNDLDEYSPLFYRCKPTKADYIIVYDANPAYSNTPIRVSFTKTCSPELQLQYKLIDQKQFYDGTLQYFRKQTITNR